MNDFSNGLNVIQDDLSAVPAEELNCVEGGLAELYESVLDNSSNAAFYQSIADWCKTLSAISRGQRP